MARSQAATPVPATLERSRFIVLFLCLSVLFTLQGVLPDGLVHVHLDLAFSLVLVAALWSVSGRRSLLIAGLVLVGPVLATAWLARDAATRGLVVLALVCALAFLLLTTGIVLWRVLQEKEVTTDTIFGGISVYLLLVAVWALIYSLLEQIEPASFAVTSGAPPDLRQTGRLLSPRLVDYSVMVLTGLGSQDLRPATTRARAWTGLEAIVSQLYLAILIARLVGLHASRSDARPAGG
jgi:hypothetical protein